MFFKQADECHAMAAEQMYWLFDTVGLICKTYFY